jgi:glycosyltransferase involved in cell wall biosynthesis
MDRPDVTIAITTLNRPDLAARAIRSALCQTGVRVEVIVVDDGSEPPFGLQVADERIRVIRHDRPYGPCGARNSALEQARADWISFLDDDDELFPDMLITSLRAAETSTLPQPVAVLSGIEVVDSDERVVERRMPVTSPRGSHYFLDGKAIGKSYQTQNTLVVPTLLLREIGGWDPDLWGSEHDDLFLRLNAICSLEGVPQITYRMRAHAGPRRSQDLLSRARAMIRTVDKHRAVFDQHRARHGKYLGVAGLALLRAGLWRPAVDTTTRALLVSPRQLRLWLWWAAALAGPSTWKLAGRLRRRARRGPSSARGG